ncbi:hypothetical protein [Bacillus safensis]|uniref:hypothetical protein n=1 Tax=Bacillus safensis TaxID=561879 RepID=UPI0036716CA5
MNNILETLYSNSDSMTRSLLDGYLSGDRERLETVIECLKKENIDVTSWQIYDVLENGSLFWFTHVLNFRADSFIIWFDNKNNVHIGYLGRDYKTKHSTATIRQAVWKTVYPVVKRNQNQKEGFNKILPR